ncbi:MAG: hypothetical protein ACF8NJ_11110 [Phycisphaerales bacterium JB038]
MTKLTRVSPVFTLGLVSLTVACNNDSGPTVWPPTPPPDSVSPASTADASFCSEATVYEDSRREFVGGGDRRYGYAVCDGEVAVGFNLFAIEEAGDGYVPNFFEVVYFDDSQTRLRVSSEEGHQLVYEVDKDAQYRPGVLQVKTTVSYPGTKILYDGTTYEIREDGWYVDDTRVAGFEGSG